TTSAHFRNRHPKSQGKLHRRPWHCPSHWNRRRVSSSAARVPAARKASGLPVSSNAVRSFPVTGLRLSRRSGGWRYLTDGSSDCVEIRMGQASGLSALPPFLLYWRGVGEYEEDLLP